MQAPIASVTFFEGKAPRDPKDPSKELEVKDGILGQGVMNKDGLWKAKIALPDKNALELSAQFKTMTGILSSETQLLLLATPTKDGKKLAKITGKVLRGGRPQLEQPVGLVDEKGKDKGVVKTDPRTGVYVFENIEPGDYIVYSGTTFPRTYGKMAVKVPAGKELIEGIDLTLDAK